jgi:hypothetical protein
MAGQINSDNLMVRRKMGDLSLPMSPITGPAMNKDQGGTALASDSVANGDTIKGEYGLFGANACLGHELIFLSLFWVV